MDAGTVATIVAAAVALIAAVVAIVQTSAAKDQAAAALDSATAAEKPSMQNGRRIRQRLRQSQHVCPLQPRRLRLSRLVGRRTQQRPKWRISTRTERNDVRNGFGTRPAP